MGLPVPRSATELLLFFSVFTPSVNTGGCLQLVYSSVSAGRAQQRCFLGQADHCRNLTGKGDTSAEHFSFGSASAPPLKTSLLQKTF